MNKLRHLVEDMMKCCCKGNKLCDGSHHEFDFVRVGVV
jgi:hypothetical protein